ncbi:hypothetical protein BH23ACT10_BH23ACT10_06210 [soil metagenome]
MVFVRWHYRDGVYVRSHYRRVQPQVAEDQGRLLWPPRMIASPAATGDFVSQIPPRTAPLPDTPHTSRLSAHA